MFIYLKVSQSHVRQDTIRSTFETCGDIKRIKFAEDRETGEFRGFGHVEFYDGACVDKAVKLAGSDVMGRPIRVRGPSLSALSWLYAGIICCS